MITDVTKDIIKDDIQAEKGVVIACDCRCHSKEFSELAAEILAGNGIRVYLFPDMRPTPELSFSIRKIRAVSGINMTASHNPKEYKGYKVYWEDGAQISGEISDGIQSRMTDLDLFDPFPRLPLSEAVKKVSSRYWMRTWTETISTTTPGQTAARARLHS